MGVARAFELDENGKPFRVAGVPPDYFSETGQLWGNPLLSLEIHGTGWFFLVGKEDEKDSEWVDLIRLDHFRGFESYSLFPRQVILLLTESG